MKTFAQPSFIKAFIAFFSAFLLFAFTAQHADAKRFGGGKSFGQQRGDMSQRAATPPQRKNAEAAPAQQGASGAAASPAGNRSWLGPVAGIAAGLGLAALASHLGLGEEFANFLLIALLVIGGIFLFKWLTRAKNAPQAGLQYAGASPAGHAHNAPAAYMPPASVASGGSVHAAHTNTANEDAPTLPAGFDADAFVRLAKLNFLRLQAAYDAANLDDIREFTSPEVYAEISMQLAERDNAAQRTDVLDLHADVLDAVEEAHRYVVSVRFNGRIKEDESAPAVEFTEVWHLTKPASGNQGWVVAGIQQLD